jgi:hypothetical protein
MVDMLVGYKMTFLCKSFWVVICLKNVKKVSDSLIAPGYRKNDWSMND